MTFLPGDVMQAEADIYLVFTGWDANTTRDMDLNELMSWHKIALERQKTAEES